MFRRHWPLVCRAMFLLVHFTTRFWRSLPSIIFTMWVDFACLASSLLTLFAHPSGRALNRRNSPSPWFQFSMFWRFTKPLRSLASLIGGIRCYATIA